MRGGILVVDAKLRSERLAGDPQQRTRRWWALQLECGHQVERPVRYRNPPAGHRGRRRHLGIDDALPAQKAAYCPLCPSAPAHDVARLRIRATPTGAAQWVAGLRALVPGIVVDGPRWRAGGFVDYYAETSSGLPVPYAGPIAGELVDVAVRAAAAARYRHHRDLGPGIPVPDHYLDGMAADEGYRLELGAALDALAMLGYVRQRPDQEGSTYDGPPAGTTPDS